MVILKAFFSGRAWLQTAGSCCRFPIVDIFSHAMDDVFCGCGNTIFSNINFHVIRSFLNVNVHVIIYLAAGAFSLDQPGWLLRCVLCQQCWLGGLWIFLPTFLFLICSSKVYLSFPGATWAGGWWRSPRRSRIPIGLSKNIACYPCFHFQHHFDLLVCQSCQKILFITSQSCCLQVPPQRRWPIHRGNVGRQNPRGSTRTRIGLDLAAYWNGGSSWDWYKVMYFHILGLSQHQSKKLQYYSPRPSRS